MLKWRIWNDLLLDVHHTLVPSENDTNTIGNELSNRITPENTH